MPYPILDSCGSHNFDLPQGCNNNSFVLIDHEENQSKHIWLSPHLKRIGNLESPFVASLKELCMQQVKMHRMEGEGGGIWDFCPFQERLPLGYITWNPSHFQKSLKMVYHLLCIIHWWTLHVCVTAVGGLSSRKYIPWYLKGKSACIASIVWLCAAPSSVCAWLRSLCNFHWFIPAPAIYTWLWLSLTDWLAWIVGHSRMYNVHNCLSSPDLMVTHFVEDLF